jgi:hypothetical protein
MKRLPLSELHENQYFDAPVYLDEGYILLSPDVHTPKNIDETQGRCTAAESSGSAGPQRAGGSSKSTLELTFRKTADGAGPRCISA